MYNHFNLQERIIGHMLVVDSCQLLRILNLFWYDVSDFLNTVEQAPTLTPFAQFRSLLNLEYKNRWECTCLNIQIRLIISIILLSSWILVKIKKIVCICIKILQLRLQISHTGKYWKTSHQYYESKISRFKFKRNIRLHTYQPSLNYTCSTFR